MYLELAFEKPLSISIGNKPDKVSFAFRAAELFISKRSGKPLEDGYITSSKLPKQFPDEASYNLVVVTGSTVQFASNTAFLTQIGITICLAMSLKAMWNLMHTMQLVAYIGMLVNWPANSSMMFKSIHNAITLENLINPIFEAIIDDFEWIEQSKDGRGSILS